MLKKHTIWTTDLDQFQDEDHRRWSFGGGKSQPPPPPPPPEPRDDRRPDNAKSKGIEEAARTRDTQRKKGARGGLKIALGQRPKGTGLNTAGDNK